MHANLSCSLALRLKELDNSYNASSLIDVGVGGAVPLRSV